MHENLSNIVEAIIFASEQPVKRQFILAVLNGEGVGSVDDNPSAEAEAAELVEPIGEEELETVMQELMQKYQSEVYPFEVKEIAEGFQFFTKRTYYPYIKKASLTKNQKRLTRAALETLAIIAYRQPVTKSEMEYIRGVNCDYAVQKLLDKQLVSIVGRAEAAGRPLLYATSPFFMQYFGIKDMSDLPKLKEFEALAEDHMDRFKQHQSQQAKDPDAPQTEQTSGTLLEKGQAKPETPAEAQESNGLELEAGESAPEIQGTTETTEKAGGDS
jgi:segregation and condensation protein B